MPCLYGIQNNDKPIIPGTETLIKENTLSLFVTAPIEGLMQGIYQAHTDMAALKKRGDFGIGTFNHLDGEMIVMDGAVYRADTQGLLHAVADDVQTPFACVTFFHPDTEEIFDATIPPSFAYCYH
jgi:acetolactate decarboxylase